MDYIKFDENSKIILPDLQNYYNNLTKSSLDTENCLLCEVMAKFEKPDEQIKEWIIDTSKEQIRDDIDFLIKNFIKNKTYFRITGTNTAYKYDDANNLDLMTTIYYEFIDTDIKPNEDLLKFEKYNVGVSILIYEIAHAHLKTDYHLEDIYNKIQIEHPDKLYYLFDYTPSVTDNQFLHAKDFTYSVKVAFKNIVDEK